jgi:hypothetical protein
MPEILNGDWPIDSVEALEIAQAHGGSEFLASRAGWDLSLLMDLDKRQEGTQSVTYWVVSYIDYEASEVLRMKIDASTGDVEIREPSETGN